MVYSRDCIASMSLGLSLFSIARHPAHSSYIPGLFYGMGNVFFHLLTDGCRSTVGGTNVWKLLSDEYGDYNVTRDLFFLWITGRSFFTCRRMVDVRRSAVQILL